MAMSAAHVVLEAVQLATEAEVHGLRQLGARHVDILKPELVLRIILSYLPESTDPTLYTGFLRDLVTGNLSALDEAEPPTALQDDLSKDEAQRRVRGLHLLPLTDSSVPYSEPLDMFTKFLFNRAHRIDAETGSLPLVQDLLEPFLDHSEYLSEWTISTLLPLLRLDYEYYPQRVPAHSLEDFERLEESTAIYTLLSEAARRNNDSHIAEIGRDLRGLVGPWIYGENRRKRRKISIEQESSQVPVSAPGETFMPNSSWTEVNKWILDLSLRDFPRVIHAIEHWDGPGDVDYGGWGNEAEVMDTESLRAATLSYCQTGLATLYAANDVSSQTLEGMHNVLDRITDLMELPGIPGLKSEDAVSDNYVIPPKYYLTLDRSHLVYDHLLSESNPITLPSKESTELAHLLLVSARILESIGYSVLYRRLADFSLFGSAQDQMIELGRVLHTLQVKQWKDEKGWAKIRNQLRWLRCWNRTPEANFASHQISHYGVFSQIDTVELEVEILKAFLVASHYALAVETYCTQREHPLPLDRVGKVVLDAALKSYDSASNGNKTRGGVKKASDILTTFQKYFPNSTAFKKTAALLSATHALSFYSLTLQHGVPFRPANIRVHTDPISLIEKVLDQNPKSYTKLEDLLDIGRNLVRSGLVQSNDAEHSTQGFPDERHFKLTERRIIAMAIKAALAEDDFDTAYSYVVNRLSPSESPQDNSGGRPHTSRAPEDDITWKAAYQAGRARSRRLGGPSELRRLEQRMELLSQALLLAPSSAIEDVLATWRRCEEEMNVLLAQETEEENKWDDRGDRRLPGGFSGEDSDMIVQKPRESTRNAMNEEAPIGLFDIARGAAAALSKSAFPLRSPRIADAATDGATKASRPSSFGVVTLAAGDHSSLSGGEGDGRVRKRDVVSNMVTGGLASGIGWVLGAPPVRQE